LDIKVSNAKIIRNREKKCSYHVPRELCAERYPLPALSGVLCVEQDGGLADDPPLLAAEADGVEAVVEVLVLRRRDGAREPAAAAVLGLQDRLPRPQEKP
jgi:hypothetical protein